MSSTLPIGIGVPARAQSANQPPDSGCRVSDRHFSSAELRQLISFYQSPIGQKIITELPAVTQESMEAGPAVGDEARRVDRVAAQERGRPDRSVIDRPFRYS